MKNNIKILDCTLRDGGYKTNWHFSEDLVKNYLKTMKTLGIKMIEPGFRLLNKNPDFGKFAYCTDEFLQSLFIPEKFQLAVMIKAEEFFTADAQKSLNAMFKEASDSPVEIVRIAIPWQKAPECSLITEILKNKGYKVMLNLTKISPGSEKEIAGIINKIKDRQAFDALYFADTFGEFSPRDVGKIVSVINRQYYGQIGFHGHNNKNRALANSLTAIENGVNYIDSTLQGTGKGVGNLATEVIIQELKNQPGLKNYVPVINA